MGKVIVFGYRDATFYGAVCTARKGRYTVTPLEKLELSSLAGKAVLGVVETKVCHFSRETVAKGSDEVILLQISEKLERLGIFREPPLIVYWQERALGMNVEVSVLAVDSPSVSSFIERCVSHRIRLRGLYPRTVAMASLAMGDSAGCVLSLDGDVRGCTVVVTGGGMIRYLRRVTFDEFLGVSDGLLKEEIRFAIEQYERGGGEPVRKVIAYGEIRRFIEAMEDPDVISSFAPESRDFLMHVPEVAGALYAPREFSVLPPKVSLWERHLTVARAVAGGMLLLALVGGVAGWMIHRSDRELRATTAVRESTLRARVAELRREIPSDKLTLVTQLQAVRESFGKEPRIDEFVSWLTRIVPTGFQITRLSLSRLSSPSPPPGQERTTGGSPPSPSTFSLSIEGGVVVNFDEAHRVFQQVLREIHGKYGVIRSTLEYDEKSATARCVFEVRM